MRRDENYVQQLAKYIQRNVSKGYTLESLRWALVNQGHSKIEVDKAISFANHEMAVKAPVMQEKPLIKVETSPPVEESPSIWKKITQLFS